MADALSGRNVSDKDRRPVADTVLQAPKLLPKNATYKPPWLGPMGQAQAAHHASNSAADRASMAKELYVDRLPEVLSANMSCS